MALPTVSQAVKDRVIVLYRQGRLKVSEIANLNDLSANSVYLILREKFADGTLQPRQKCKALVPKPKTRKERYYEPNGRPRAWETAKDRRKIKGEIEIQLCKDYYENGFTAIEIMSKYSINRRQLQRVRDEHPEYKGYKKRGRVK